MQDSARKFKEEVAEAAISLFKRNGYNNVTVNEICKECGISRSVFYSSFNGKRSILEYMVEKPQHNDDASFMKFAHADNDFERIWQLFLHRKKPLKSPCVRENSTCVVYLLLL